MKALSVMPILGARRSSQVHRGTARTVRASLTQAANRTRAVLSELAEDMLQLSKKDDSTLNYMYKHLPVGTERKLENFNGERKISVYRGADYMNKITQRLSDPPLTFIRSMKNAGTTENPKLVTTAVSLRVPNKPEEIIVRFLEEEPRQLFLKVTRRDFEAHKALYPNWHELRQDPIFQKVLKFMTGVEVPPKR